MNIYLVNYILVLLWAVVFLYSKGAQEDYDRRKKYFVIIVCIQWILISGLRADSVGNDTKSYMSIFDSCSEMSWGEIFSYFKYYVGYIKGLNANNVVISNIEPGIMVLNKVISIFTTNHVVYKTIIATIFMVAFGNYVYRYSDNPAYSFALYGVLFFNMFSLTGYRQVLATAIAVLYGYQFIRERKLVKFLILIAIAYIFHKSTIAFAVFYFLANKKLTKQYIAICSVLFVLELALRHQVFSVLKAIGGYYQYSGNYGFSQLGFTIMFVLLTLVAAYLYPAIVEEDETAVQYYNGLILSWIIFPFIIEDPSVMRLLLDFAFVLILLLPKMVLSFKSTGTRIIAGLSIYSIFLVYTITNIGGYQFFWQ